MAATLNSTTVRNTMTDAYVGMIDVGTANPGGRFQFWSDDGGTPDALIVEVQFSDPACGAAGEENVGEAIADVIAPGAAVISATAVHVRLINRDEAHMTWYLVGEDMILDTDAITVDDVVTVTDARFTYPVGA